MKDESRNLPDKTRRGGDRPAPSLFLKLLLALALALLLLAAVLLPVIPALSAEHEHKCFLALPMRDGETFRIRYNHSVNRSPVIDAIERDGDIMVVRTSLFLTYGAGIPVLSDGVGTKLVTTDEGLMLTGIDAPHESIALITGTYSDHRILWRDREIILKSLIGEKQLIELHIQRVSLLALLLYAA